MRINLTCPTASVVTSSLVRTGYAPHVGPVAEVVGRSAMRVFWVLAALVVSIALVGCGQSPPPASSQASGSPLAAAARGQAIAHNENQARALVELFGSRQQNVWLQSPRVDSQVRAQYRSLVTTALLDRWLAHPDDRSRPCCLEPLA